MPRHHRALIAAVAVLGLPATAWPQDADYWAPQPMGWTYLNSSPDMMQYVRAAAGGGNHPRIWVRYERRYPTKGLYAYQSSAVLEEVDCGQRRSRALQARYYQYPNLSGDQVYSEAPDPPTWDYALPGTFGDAVVGAVCD